MIIKKREDSYRISKKAALSCLVAASVILSNGVMAKAADTINNTAVTASIDAQNTNEKHDFLVDTPLKVYDDVQKTEKISNLKFKVPDYLPEGYKADSEAQILKITDTDNSVIKYFDKDRSGMFSFIAFKTDPVESLKKVVNEKTYADKLETEQKSMVVSGVNGTNITIKTTKEIKEYNEDGSESGKTDKFNETYQYFVWQDSGIWYSINYSEIVDQSNGKTKEFVKLSEDDMGKIVKSIKYPEEVTSVSYQKNEEKLSTEVVVMCVYDKEDLEKAKSLLGFNPKFPLTINENIKVRESSIGVAADSDIENNKINYELDNFYNNKGGSITFTQGKTSKHYEDIITKGYVEYSDTDKVKAEKLSINNIDVYKLDETSDKNFSTPCMTYLWKDGDTYCSTTFFKNIENSDELVKDFMNSKPIA